MRHQSTHCIRTLRMKVKSEVYPWLRAAAAEVNQVWNYSNENSYKAGRPFAGPPRWLGAFELDKLTAGAAKYFEWIGSATIQRVNAEFATRRKQFKTTRLRWRVSRGSRQSLGWIPLKAEQLKRNGKALRFSGKAIRVFEFERLAGISFKSGSFAEDSVGDWWLCVAVEVKIEPSMAPYEEVGLDLGIKHIVSTSDGDRLEATHFYRNSEKQLAKLQRRGHKRQSKRLHRTVARRRKDALHTCGALSGPKGLSMLVVRTWMCTECGGTHDRDVNAARNILFAGRSSPSMSGNELSTAVAEPSQTYGRCEAGKSELRLAA